MSYRFVSLWLVTLGLSCWLVACGGGSTGNNSDFDATVPTDGPHGGHEDVKLKKSPDATQMLMLTDGGGMTCTKNTCSELHAGCGFQSDGCGGMLDCGKCTAPETCGGGGAANQCGTPNPDAGGDGGTIIPTGTLTIAPLNQTISVTYGQHTPPVTYTAQVGGTSVAASFSIDLGQIGTVNASTGVMTPSGLIGGIAHVTATFGTQTVSTPLTVTVQLTANGAPAHPDGGVDAGSNAGGNGGVGGSPAGGPVSMATQTLLTQTTPAPTTDASLSWLYPYNHTVWPQGILAPLLQWQTTKTYDAVYVQLKESGFSYQGFFATPAAGKPFVNVPILQSAWDTLVYSNSGDPVTVTLTFSSGGVAYGPISETWVIAQGSLTGTVYYQSYGTALAINYPGTAPYPAFGGATLAIKHGATSPVLVAGGNGNTTNCRVCHSVAAGGGTLITQHGDNYDQSSAYALTTMSTETVMPPTGGGATVGNYAFPAIYPDGTFLLSDSAPLVNGNAPATSSLFSVPAGAAIASSGLPANFSAGTPSFSPDGTHVAFNQYGVDQVSLASMAFAESTKTFSGLQVLTKPPAGTVDLYPAFLPTNNAIVYEHQVSSDGEFGVTRAQNGLQTRADLWWVDLATQTAAPLTTLNGLIGTTSYLPNYGTNHADDQTLQYEPTVNPVPSGGYAWVVFTSRRLYGNVATQDPFLSDPRNYNATENVTTKKLWVAAIDLNAAPGSDPSHPAFYLPAQELYACNSRGYWVVDPCEAAGAPCQTGDQCCTGYCGPGDGGGFVCGTQPAGCAVLGNKCTMASDCCGATTGISCIDGFCAVPSQPHDAGGCVATTCAKLGINCGPAGDGCGGLLECGTCASPDTCGGGGTSGICGMPKGPP